MGRTPATWGVVGIAGLVTVALCAYVTRSVLTATGVLAVDPDVTTGREAAALGLDDAQAVRAAEGLSTVLTVPAALVCLVLLVGLLRWRPWAREALGGVFGLVGGLLCLFGLGGLTGGAAAGVPVLAAGLLLLAAVGLAVSRPVREDFARREVFAQFRERRRCEDERREAQRREALARHRPRIPDQRSQDQRRAT